MTNEEAIKEIKIIREDYWDEYEDTMPALDMAIKALEQQSEDAISRAEAVRVASGYCHPSNIAKELAKLPPVTPKQKTGHWRPSIMGISECSECGYDNGLAKWNFCPICGARMIESQAESEVSKWQKKGMQSKH